MDLKFVEKIATEWGLSIAILIGVIYYFIRIGSKQSHAIIESLDRLNDTTRDFKETNNFMRTRIEEGSAKLDKGASALAEIKEQIKYHTQAIENLSQRLDLLSKIDTQNLKEELRNIENKIDNIGRQ